MNKVITELDLLHLSRAVLYSLLDRKVITKADLIKSMPKLGIDEETAVRLLLLIHELQDGSSDLV